MTQRFRLPRIVALQQQSLLAWRLFSVKAKYLSRIVMGLNVPPLLSLSHVVLQ